MLVYYSICTKVEEDTPAIITYNPSIRTCHDLTTAVHIRLVLHTKFRHLLHDSLWTIGGGCDALKSFVQTLTPIYPQMEIETLSIALALGFFVVTRRVSV